MNLADLIKDSTPAILDGAMGTQLADAGHEMGGQNCVTNPDAVVAAATRSMSSPVKAMLDFEKQGIPTFDYGNNIRQVAFDDGIDNAFDFSGFVPAYVRPLFCRGVGPFRWVALSGDPEGLKDETGQTGVPDLFEIEGLTREMLMGICQGDIDGDGIPDCVEQPNLECDSQNEPGSTLQSQKLKYWNPDSDGDKTPDYNGPEKIATLVEKWGGIVRKDVAIDTDFMILGELPDIPRKPTFEQLEVDPMAMDKYDVLIERLTRYRQVKKQADTLSIPIFNTERFLYFAGYREQAKRPGAF